MSVSDATVRYARSRAWCHTSSNTVLSTPNGRALDRALAQLDFYVAIDVYINETTRHADLVLPPASPLTQPHYDLIFNSFAVRRVARLNAPTRARREDERGDWEIINGLGAAFAAAAGKPWSEVPDDWLCPDCGVSKADFDMQEL